MQRRKKQAELGQKAKIEENPPMQRRKKQAELGEKLKKRIFAPTGSALVNKFWTRNIKK